MTEINQQHSDGSQVVTATELNNSKGKTEKKLRKKNTQVQFLVEAFAVFVWGYSLIKVFVFDLDLYLIQKFFPDARWIIDYKFLFILGAISVLWLFKKSTSIAQNVFYILLYPVIFCVWKVPKTLIKRKSWIGAFALIGILLSFFRNLKFNTIISFIGLSSFCIILNTHNTVALYFSCTLLFCVLVFLYAKSLYVSVRPSLLFQIQSEVIDKFWKNAKTIFVPPEEVKDLSIKNMNSSQLQTWSTNLQFAIIFNYTCYFLSTKLQDFQRSRVNILYYIINFLILVITTVVIFAAIFNGLYKIDSSQFSSSFSPNYFQSLYFSAITFTTVGYGDLIPVGFNQLVAAVEALIGLFIMPLFVVGLSRKYLRV